MKQIIFLCILLLATFSCKRDPISAPPQVILEVFPSLGDSETPFHFDLRRTTDDEDVIENLDARFDWDSDGVWDTLIQGLRPMVRSFKGGGTHLITVEVEDRTGQKTQESANIEVFGDPEMSELIDPRDGQVYPIVRLGERWWMAAHLKYGTAIETNKMAVDNEVVEYYYPGKEAGNLEQYGALYSWGEAMGYSKLEGSQGICPPGWHIPTLREWNSISREHPSIYLNYFYGAKGPSGLNLELAGELLIYKQLGGVVNQWEYGTPGSFCALWSSSSSSQKLVDLYIELEVKQDILKGVKILSVDQGSPDPGSFGFLPIQDIRHVEGDMDYYVRNYAISHSLTARSVRCIKDE